MKSPTLTPFVHVIPPLVETNAMTDPVNPRNGTMTLPFGFTSGRPPMPKSCPCVATAGLHVTPPSVEVLIWIKSPALVLSHSE